jgi:hypothetical protein
MVGGGEEKRVRTQILPKPLDRRIEFEDFDDRPFRVIQVSGLVR